MKTDFTNIDYLKSGNGKQARVYDLLTQHRILSTLAAFDPIVVGTIPIEVDIESSDIDIICYCANQQQFTDTLISHFQDMHRFRFAGQQGPDQGAIISTFMLEEFEVEIFGQNIPTREQFAYRHMLIEHKLLQEKGEAFRRQVVELKRQGLKTEPAFAHLLGLEGDPYVALLNFEVGS